jgi:hypothetical protein
MDRINVSAFIMFYKNSYDIPCRIPKNPDILIGEKCYGVFSPSVKSLRNMPRFLWDEGEKGPSVTQMLQPPLRIL